MPGLRFHNEGSRWRLEADNASVLVAALGEHLLAAFARCFAAVDRLATIADMILLNHERVGQDTLRGERNLNALGIFAAGLVYEFREGLRHLQKAGIEGRLSEQGKLRWQKIAPYMDPKTEEILHQLRNCLAFHLGEERVVRRGIRILAEKKDRRLCILAGDGPAAIQTRHDFGADLVLAGIRVPDEAFPLGPKNPRRPLDGDDLEAAYSESVDAHLALVHRLDEVFFDVLRQAGANLEPLLPDLADADPPSQRDER
jgi:hypothetical protein